MKKRVDYIWEVSLKWILKMAKISQKMSLKQQLSPQQILQANLLQLNLPLLEQRILHELEINPALELIELPNDSEIESLPDEKNDLDEDIEFEWEELLGVNDDYDYTHSKAEKEIDYDAPLISNDTFSDQIIKQLQDSNLNKQALEIAEQILGNLDAHGYLNIEPSLISDRMQLEESDVLNVMYKIQKLDPPGIAARNMQECLLIQAKVRNENQTAVTILENYFDDFASHRYEKIIDAMQCTKQELNDAMEFIARLNPSPRDEQQIINPDIIIPDVLVEERDGEYHVSVPESLLPEVKVSETYVKMYDKHKKEKDVKNFIKKKLESATWFVDAINQRKESILKVMQSIINHQKDYFNSIERILKPMILKDVANDIGMDISTVSRVTNGKYVQLPWEVKELKTFFSEGIKTNQGDSVSSIEVKKALKEIIDNEDVLNPISDQDLTELLNSKGYTIARRTVTKYREQFKIPTARLRRKLK